MNILELSHVSKAFGSRQVIRDLSLSVPEHTIYGFIGQNGAGKTTTMKMILGLYTIDHGTITVNGEPVKYGGNATNRMIGYLPDVPEFYSYMTPSEYLFLCGEVTGMEKKVIRERSEELLCLVGLEKENKRIRGFSRGMKQRLGVAQALLNNPKLLLCDEPTSALDPLGRRDLLKLLQSVKERTTIIFSTHILSDVERISDEIGLIKDGTLALSGTTEELRALRKSDGFEIEFRNNTDAERFAGLCDNAKRPDCLVLFFENQGEREMKRAMEQLSQQGIVPRRIELREPTLESLFIETIEKKSGHTDGGEQG